MMMTTMPIQVLLVKIAVPAPLLNIPQPHIHVETAATEIGIILVLTFRSTRIAKDLVSVIMKKTMKKGVDTTNQGNLIKQSTKLILSPLTAFCFRCPSALTFSNNEPCPQNFAPCVLTVLVYY